MSDQRTLAGEVGAKADVVDIALRSVEADLEPPEKGELEVSVSWETSFERLRESHLEYRYRVAVTALTSTALSIRAEFALTYAVEDLPKFTDDHLAAFGDVSVAFSAFPYARELIQSVTTRASLPPFVLGTLRAPIDPPPARRTRPTLQSERPSARKATAPKTGKKAASRSSRPVGKRSAQR